MRLGRLALSSRRNDIQPGWAWCAVEFTTLFDGHFSFYLPTAWPEVRHDSQQIAALGDAAGTRQIIPLTPKHFWREHLSEYLAGVTVIAFAFYP